MRNITQQLSGMEIPFEEILATALAVLLIIIKLAINREATPIATKKTLVSLPGEIYGLVLGFLMSDMVSGGDIVYIFVCVVTALFTLAFVIIHYKLESWLVGNIDGESKLSGSRKSTWAFIVIPLVWAISLYIFVVWR